MWNCAEQLDLLGIGVVKNEQDIIEPFVRHHIRLLDRLVILDNGSVDRTKEILDRLAREFPALEVTHDDQFGHTQFQRMNQLLQASLRTYHPKFVIPLDADEFLGVSNRSGLCEALMTIPPGGFGLVPWRTFVVTPDTVDECVVDPPKSFRYRRRGETPVYYKAVLRPEGEQCDNLELDFGSHNVRSIHGREIPSVSLDALKLLHFPVRSREQFVARIVIGWMANLTRDPNVRYSGSGYQKRDNFDRIARGDQIDELTLCECSLLYAQSPRPIDWQSDIVGDVPHIAYVRQYSDGKAMDAIQLIARSWAQSLQATDGSRQSQTNSRQEGRRI